MRGIALAGSVVVAWLAPAVAHADEDAFVVDTNSASAGLTACTGAAADCSLVGAFANADDADTSDEDTISFDSSIFDGVETVPGDATVVLTDHLTSDEPLVLTASCASPGPCVGIDGPFSAGNAITVLGGSFEMSRIAIFGTTHSAGLAYLFGPTELTVSGSWFGLKLDGTPEANDVGVNLTGSNATIGLIGEPPNFFAGNGVGILVFAGTQGDVIQNSAFGIRPNGVLAANTDADINALGNGVGTDPTDIRIGAEPNATALCDAGCNIIAAAGAKGIDLSGNGPDTSGASNVDILGNHIGMNALGTTVIGSAAELVHVGEADDVTISGNRLGGGIIGVNNDVGSDNLLVEENSMGLNAAGDAVLTGPTQAIVLESDALDDVVVARNEIAGPGTPQSLITIEGGHATVDENILGLPGSAGSGGQDAISLNGTTHLVEENSISETVGHGITVNGSSNSIAGNEIGVDGPIGGAGIVVHDDPFHSQFNVIGGTDETRANVITNVGEDAIRMEGVNSAFNTVEVNLGDAPSGLFLDLEPADGPGNDESTGPNEGIQKPKIKSVEKDRVEGKKADPDAKVWLFLSASVAGVEPVGVTEFLGKKGVKDDGKWKFKPDENIGKHDVVTALQTDSTGNSSELAKGKQR